MSGRIDILLEDALPIIENNTKKNTSVQVYMGALHVDSLSSEREELRRIPAVFRKAKAYQGLLERVPVRIGREELIVGEPIVDGFPPCFFEDEIEAFSNPTGSLTPNNVTPSYARLLRLGLAGIIGEARYKLKSSAITSAQKWFLEAVIVCCEALQTLILRYAEAAEVLAGLEENGVRKEELQKIAASCRYIASGPPRTFYEALQLIWFAYVALKADGSLLLGFGRMDQYLYPYFQRDLARGILTTEEALELLACFWIKVATMPTPPGYYAGDNGQTIMLGGQTRQGDDAVNELSYLCLETTMRLKLIDPKVLVRFCRKSPYRFLEKACELAAMGLGFPTMCNDEVIIPALTSCGYDLEDARDYVTAGCYEPIIPGRSDDRVNWGQMCFLKCVEYAINNGKSLLGGEKEGLDLGNLLTISSFDELYQNVKAQIDYTLAKLAVQLNLKRYGPAPMLSAIMDDCVPAARDISEGGCKYNSTGIWGNGLANAVDALAALKKCVYETGELSREQVYRVLQQNYEGEEWLRQYLLNKAPKFGNDDDYVDYLAKDLAEYYAREAVKYRNQWGGRFRPSLASAGSYVFTAKTIGATPDGRRAAEPFANGFSPAPGRDGKGPTALINSLAKIDLRLFPDGAPTDIKLSPTTVQTAEGVAKLVGLVRAFLDQGGMQVQFNVVDTGVLRAAQQEPDKYRNLIVRVWGFSAYFVTLDKEFQDHVIARYEHCI